MRWKSWHSMAIPFSVGGLEFRSISKVMKALCMNLAWNFLNSNFLWASFFWNKYIEVSLVIFNDLVASATRYLKDL